MTRYWIQKSKMKKGALTSWAKKHHFYKNGKIELTRAYQYAKKHHLTKEIRRINLARTLRRIKHK
ncbi:MAG: hypothetical protein QXV17_07235 [Candidatus Micrarchaeaceae archaeon]